MVYGIKSFTYTQLQQLTKHLYIKTCIKAKSPNIDIIYICLNCFTMSLRQFTKHKHVLSKPNKAL